MAEERRSKTSGELAKAHGFADEAPQTDPLPSTREAPLARVAVP